MLVAVVNFAILDFRFKIFVSWFDLINKYSNPLWSFGKFNLYRIFDAVACFLNILAESVTVRYGRFAFSRLYEFACSNNISNIYSDFL